MFGGLEAHLWTSHFTPMVPPVPLGRERDMDWLKRGTKTKKCTSFSWAGNKLTGKKLKGIQIKILLIQKTI